MCVAAPMKVVKIDGETVVAELGGTTKEARLDIVDEMPVVGDFVIIHAGFALHRIDPEEAKITLELWKEMGVIDEVPE
ncbi:MAG: HypC/HybG/HupF family hydrogenase formation chaperone [Deltaproteobacteria bacterium]|nr:HypC/HybG/HupF family hydrogenase formation chaperone [Deltaproteobacteria bacterium]MBW2317185.1 HypC/HybG/HupF family hydrogenase formation chaperone [Deltaproteobacteria bacterium]